MSSEHHVPIDRLVERLAQVPVAADIAPDISPRNPPFLDGLFEGEVGVLATQYHSPNLVDALDPGSQELSFLEEASHYIDSMDAADRSDAETLANQISGGADPTPKSVCIAVATHQEGEKLRHTLSHHARQTLGRDDFEVILFLNRPRFDDQGRSTSDEETMRALEDFQVDFPDVVTIHELNAVFEDALPVGEIKKKLHDAAIIRHFLAGSIDPVLVLNDADMVYIPDGYLQGLGRYFDTSRLVDAVVGEFDLDHKTYLSSPILHVAQRLHTIISALKGNTISPVTTGNNTAIRASAYCAVGGTPKIRKPVEDAYLGITLCELRSSYATVLRPQHDKNIQVQVSARRAVAAWKQGYAPNEKWRLGFSAHDDEIRTLTDGDYDESELLDDPGRFHKRLEYILNRLIANYERPEDDPHGWESDLYHSAFALLGLSYVVKGGEASWQLELGDTTDIRQALRAFRQNAL